MKTIYLIMGQRGKYDEFVEFPVVTATTEERANRIVEIMNALTAELAKEIDALPVPALTSWTDPDEYQRYYKECAARGEKVLEINTRYQQALPLGVKDISYGTSYAVEKITLVEE